MQSATAEPVASAPQAPWIASFGSSRLNIVAGESITLSWATQGGTEISIQAIGRSLEVASIGEVTIVPPVTLEYELVVAGPGGRASKSLTIEVLPPAVVAAAATPAESERPNRQTSQPGETVVPTDPPKVPTSAPPTVALAASPQNLTGSTDKTPDPQKDADRIVAVASPLVAMSGLPPFPLALLTEVDENVKVVTPPSDPRTGYAALAMVGIVAALAVVTLALLAVAVLRMMLK
jgi:hypothetical protein